MSCSDSSFPPGRWVAELSPAPEHPAAALAPGCSPRRGGGGHAGCHTPPARPPDSTPAMLFYQFSPSAVRGKLGTRLCFWLSNQDTFPPLSSLAGRCQTHPSLGAAGRGGSGHHGVGRLVFLFLAGGT